MVSPAPARVANGFAQRNECKALCRLLAHRSGLLRRRAVAENSWVVVAFAAQSAPMVGTIIKAITKGGGQGVEQG